MVRTITETRKLVWLSLPLIFYSNKVGVAIEVAATALTLAAPRERLFLLTFLLFMII